MTTLHAFVYLYLYRACDILKTIGNLKDYSNIIDRNQRLLNDSSNNQPASPSNTPSASNGSGAGIGTVPLCIKDGFKLQVLPSPVMLTKLNVELFTMEQCAPILVRLYTYISVYTQFLYI